MQTTLSDQIGKEILMSNTLCVYCTRTNHTKRIMETIAAELGADVALITDGVNRTGTLGYINAAVTAMRKRLPDILAINTPKPIREYDKIILGAPVWVETVCPLAKAFLKRYAPLIHGEVFYVVTHMADNPYEEQIQKLDGFLGKAHIAHLSVSTKKDDLNEEIADFVSKILKI